MKRVTSFTHFLQGACWQYHFLLSRKVLVVNGIELKLMMAAAIIGLSNSSKNGNKILSKIETPIELYTNARIGFT